MRNIYTETEARLLVNGGYDEDLVEYLKANSTEKQRVIFTEDDYQHIAHCLKDLVAELFGLYPAGDLYPILKNDLFGAIGACDNINRLAISLYIIFLYNKVPASLLAQKRKRS